MKFFTRILAALATTAMAFTLGGCSQTVALEPAPDSNNPLCAEVSVRVPDSLDALARRSTNAQATSAWGDPAAVILRCGVAPVAVSQLKCITIADVDWLVDGAKAPNYRFITFGRTPATEVIIDSKRASGATVLDELSSVVDRGKVSKRCL